MKKLVALLLFAFLGFGSSKAQCDVPSSVKNGKFDVVIPKEKMYKGNKKHVLIKKGEYLKYNLQIKTPNKLSEIKDRPDIISCSGISVLPGAAKIKTVKINSIKNVPPGMKYSFSNSNRIYNGNSTGCIYISGTPTQKGVYNLKIDVEGEGGLFGVTKSVECNMNQFVVHVQ